MIFYSALKAFVLLQDPLVYAYLKLNPFMQGDVAVLPFDDVLFVSAFVHCSRHVMENSLFFVSSCPLALLCILFPLQLELIMSFVHRFMHFDEMSQARCRFLVLLFPFVLMKSF